MDVSLLNRGEERDFDSVSLNLYFFCSVSEGSCGLWVKPAFHIPRALGPAGPMQKGLWSHFRGLDAVCFVSCKISLALSES